MSRDSPISWRAIALEVGKQRTTVQDYWMAVIRKSLYNLQERIGKKIRTSHGEEVDGCDPIRRRILKEKCLRIGDALERPV